jgi:hypothetical protein
VCLGRDRRGGGRLGEGEVTGEVEGSVRTTGVCGIAAPHARHAHGLARSIHDGGTECLSPDINISSFSNFQI